MTMGVDFMRVWDGFCDSGGWTLYDSGMDFV